MEDDVLGRLGGDTVEQLCGLLPPDQRAVLLLRILADLTVEQVAAVLGRSVGSVKALQRRGLRALRDHAGGAGGLTRPGGADGAGVATAHPYAAVRR